MKKNAKKSLKRKFFFTPLWEFWAWNIGIFHILTKEYLYFSFLLFSHMEYNYITGGIYRFELVENYLQNPKIIPRYLESVLATRSHTMARALMIVIIILYIPYIYLIYTLYIPYIYLICTDFGFSFSFIIAKYTFLHILDNFVETSDTYFPPNTSKTITFLYMEFLQNLFFVTGKSPNSHRHKEIKLNIFRFSIFRFSDFQIFEFQIFGFSDF